MRTVSGSILICLSSFYLAGCTTPAPQPDVRVISQPTIITTGVDADDYGNVATFLYNSLARSGKVRQGKVVALGPVAVNLDTGDRFDARTLQEDLQVYANRGGLFDFTFAVDAMSQISDSDGNVQARDRMRIMQLEFEKTDTIDPEDLRTWGSLANVDYLLFGRIKSMTARKGSYTEVTYRYNWKLGDCRSGLLVWTDQHRFTKAK